MNAKETKLIRRKSAEKLIETEKIETGSVSHYSSTLRVNSLKHF